MALIQEQAVQMPPEAHSRSTLWVDCFQYMALPLPIYLLINFFKIPTYVQNTYLTLNFFLVMTKWEKVKFSLTLWLKCGVPNYET